MKNIKWSQKGLKFQYVALNVACWMQKKVLSWNKLRKMKCLCNRWVFVWNPCNLKEMVQFVHEVDIHFCRNPLNFCTHVRWVKWWYHAKFQPFLSSGCSALQFQGHLAENKSLNAWKRGNEVGKDWNFSLWLWMQKKFWVDISLEKWNFFATDEFSSETLVIWKR